MIRVSLILLSLLLPPSLQAEEFGRLFTTPIQRSNLDYLRQSSKLPTIETSSENADANNNVTSPTMPLEPPPEVSVQGYVKRSDGKKSTVWVNNTPMQEGTKNSDFQIGKLKHDSNRVDISIPANNTRVRLKAGQVYDTETNSVVEASVQAKRLTERATPKDVPEEPIQTEQPLVDH